MRRNGVGVFNTTICRGLASDAGPLRSLLQRRTRSGIDPMWRVLPGRDPCRATRSHCGLSDMGKRPTAAAAERPDSRELPAQQAWCSAERAAALQSLRRRDGADGFQEGAEAASVLRLHQGSETGLRPVSHGHDSRRAFGAGGMRPSAATCRGFEWSIRALQKWPGSRCAS